MPVRDPTQIPRAVQQAGLTLTETMITLAVASILLTAAVPPMQDFITRNRMSTEVNTFIASLHLARSEAVKRMQNVSLCPVDSDGDCDTASTDWNQGWKVYYVDAASSNEVSLQQNPALPGRFTIDGSQSTITYNSQGQANAGNYSFCDTDHVAQGRKVIVSSEGRVRVEQLTLADCS